MQKIYLMLMSAALISLVACGGEEKKEDKKDKGDSEEEAEEPKKEEAKVDYSYVLPQIDTTALGTEEEILTAMDKVISARLLDDSLAENVAGYSGYFSELNNIYAIVTEKASKYSSGLKSKEATVFNKKWTDITDRMHKN